MMLKILSVAYKIHRMEIVVPSYLRKTHLYKLNTRLIWKQNSLFEFADTIFHLQGGGQPNDKGWILYKDLKIEIQGGNLERETGKIRYKLSPEAEEIAEGEEVVMEIDPETRRSHARIHSAGHLIDLAVQRLEYKWEANKGYHFADGPYVEYKGVADEPEKMMAEINKQLELITTQHLPTKIELFTYNEAVQKQIIPETFKTSYVRMITIDNSGCPCGGTHIQNTDEIKRIEVTKVQKKGKNLKVSYKVE